MADSKTQGVSYSAVIGIVFVILKLVGTIDWSWWYVLLPFYWWIPFCIVLGFVYFVVQGLIVLSNKIGK